MHKKNTVDAIMNLTPPSLEASLNECDAATPTNCSTPPVPSVPSHPSTNSSPVRHSENMQRSLQNKCKVQNDNLRKELKKIKKQNLELKNKLKAEHLKSEKYRKKIQRTTQRKLGGTVSETFQPRAPKKMTSERKKRVESFLVLDENSILLPGKKDTIGRGEKKQRRILTSTLQDLHKAYNENSDEMHRMSYRQFTRYKPFYITEPKPSDRNTCACHQHENMRLLMTTLSKRGLITTTSLSTLLSTICCSTNNDLCMRRQCTECCFELAKVRAHDPAESVTWEQWQKEDVTVGEKTYKNWVKRTKRGSVGNLLEVFQKDLEELAGHHYNWIHQIRQFQHLKENLHSKEMVLHIDFSENYACKLNTEIQAFHFGGNRQQATLHTGMAYGTGGSLSYATVSQSLRHDERAVWAHIKPVLEDFKAKSDHDIDTLHILSDGPATQYRNCTNCFLLSTVPYTLGFTKITWNFSERSHGKGAPDGVSGALKCCADKYVHGGGDLQTPKDLFNHLQDNTEKVNRWVEDYKIVRIDGLLPPTVLVHGPDEMSVPRKVAKVTHHF